MKRILIALAAGMLAIPAFAADMLEDRLTPADGTKTYGADVTITDTDVIPPEVEVSLVQWSGFFAGGGVGYNSWKLEEVEGYEPSDLLGVDIDSSGLALGAFGGLNMEVGGGWVVGAELAYTKPMHDYSLSYDFDDSISFEFTDNSSGDSFEIEEVSLEASLSLDWMLQLAPRIGYVIEDRTMIYAKAGAAYAQFDASASLSGYNAAFDTTGSIDVSSDPGAWGWTVGAGVEHMVTDRVFVGLDYSFAQFEVDADVSGSATVGSTTYDSGTLGTIDTDFGIHTVMGRIGVRF